MENITSKIVDSITKINEEDWDSVFGKLPEGYSFYKTLEESRLKEFSFYYAILYHDNKIIGIVPLFIAAFDVNIVADGVIEKIINSVRKIFPRFMILRTLFCGSPFGENGRLGIMQPIADKDAVLDELVKALDVFCRQKRIPLVIFKDFLKQDTVFLDGLTEKNFFKTESFPGVAVELNYDSFEKYLGSLGHSTRKSLRKKLRQAYSSADISVKVVEHIDNLVDDILRLYENTYYSGSTKFEKLTKEFFLSISTNLSPHVRFFLYYVNGKLGAFNLCFNYKDLFIDKFIGFDYDISNRYNLYFVSWCFNIEWCLKNSIRLYQSGQTDYQPKLRLGGSLIPLFAYLKHKNPLMNSLLKLLAKIIVPASYDTGKSAL